MKRVKVSGVYYVRGSTGDKRCSVRLERMLRSIDTNSVNEASYEELDALIAELGSDLGAPSHPYLFFGRFRQLTPAQEHDMSQKYPHIDLLWCHHSNYIQ